MPACSERLKFPITGSPQWKCMEPLSNFFKTFKREQFCKKYCYTNKSVEEHIFLPMLIFILMLSGALVCSVWIITNLLRHLLQDTQGKEPFVILNDTYSIRIPQLPWCQARLASRSNGNAAGFDWMVFWSKSLEAHNDEKKCFIWEQRHVQERYIEKIF